MEHNLLTLDFWQDTVTYGETTVPTGSIGCEALNIPAEIINELDKLCLPLAQFLGNLTTSPDTSLLPTAQDHAEAVFELLAGVSPFSCQDIPFYKEAVRTAFTKDGVQDFRNFSLAMLTGTTLQDALAQHRTGALLGRLLPVLAQLGTSLREFQNTMTAFAESMDAPSAQRTPEGLAALFGQKFPPDQALTGDDSWMAITNTSLQYVSALRPGAQEPMMVKRMHFVSFVGLLRTDLFEGLCVGHAPKQCPICGRWFLTTNARHTKYCGNRAPGDPQGRTCRQIGNLRGREHRELANNHPLKQIYERRLNTINHNVQRGTLDEKTAAAMKRLAKDKLLRALRDADYAKGAYPGEMEQAALLAEVRRNK